MIQFRRLVSILLGVWLGAGIAVDIAVTQNFSTVDRFLQSPGTVGMVMEINRIGRSDSRELLRRNAAEENNFLFENWERAQFAIGILLLFLLVFGERPQVTMIVAVAVMLLIVAVQSFAFTPKIAELGREIAGMPADASEVKKFWTLHGVYSGTELLKLGIGLLLAVRLAVRRKQDRDLFRKEYEASLRSSSPVGKAVS